MHVESHRGFYGVLRRSTRFRVFAFLSTSHEPWLVANETLGERIKRLREARRLTQAQLGMAMAVSSKTIGNWENGRNDPRSSIGALNNFFGVDLEADEPASDPLAAALRRSGLEEWRQTRVLAVYQEQLAAQHRQDAG